MHRLPTDEIFHFYLGEPKGMIVLEKGQPGDLKSIGNDLNRSLPQYVVKKGIGKV
jgi:predicted cupin superfamily sugar epimerase